MNLLFLCGLTTDEGPRQVVSRARLSSSRDCGENTDNEVNRVRAHLGYEDARLGNAGVDECVEGTEEGYPLREGVDMRECVGVREGTIDEVAE